MLETKLEQAHAAMAGRNSPVTPSFFVLANGPAIPSFSYGCGKNRSASPVFPASSQLRGFNGVVVDAG
jgi:hypothetical protein